MKINQLLDTVTLILPTVRITTFHDLPAHAVVKLLLVKLAVTRTGELEKFLITEVVKILVSFTLYVQFAEMHFQQVLA